MNIIDNNQEENNSTARLVKLYASAVDGINATTITIEAQRSSGTKFSLVGLPDTAVKESSMRIQAAMQESGYEYSIARYIINLAPADLRKEGTAYDLPLALALIALNLNFSTEHLAETIFMGELSLDGTIKPIHGILPMAINAQKEGFKQMIVPAENALEASVVQGITIYAASTLQEVVAFARGELNTLSVVHYAPNIQGDEKGVALSSLDFRDVKGQEAVKRAMEVAAAGMHNILMVGPPGSGKSMMAKRVPSILPPFTMEEALETTMIHSVAGVLPPGSGLMSCRPFRAPHHSTSNVALVGGGSYPRPGEISLAHNGVLFLDELPEFQRSVLEVLRQPLEDRTITISRARQTVNYPASFMLVASMNPCPCGHYTNPKKACTCNEGMVLKYLGRISGPLLDRIDIQCEIAPIEFNELANNRNGEDSATIRERVVYARKIQAERFRHFTGIHANAQMTAAMTKEYVRVSSEGMNCLKMAMEKLSLSARAYDRILKVARTIADLDGSPTVELHHIGEAVNYRKMDRESWGRKI